MIVVFGDEVQMVDQSEGLFESRMRDRPGKQSRLKSPHLIHEPQARLPELGKNLLNATRIVSRFVSFSIAQVGMREFSGARHVVVNSRDPQRLEVEQMSGVLLRRPLSCRFMYQPLPRTGADNFLQPCGRTS